MTQSLDMNSHRILNLPAPISELEPARLVDLANATTTLTSIFPFINAADYGVVGDDYFDNTIAFNKFFAALRSLTSPPGAIGYIPRGIYRVSGLNATSLKGIRIVGASGASEVLGSGGNTGTVFRAVYQTSPVAVIDLTSSSDCIIESIKVLSKNADGTAPAIVPTFGIMCATQSAGDSDRLRFNNISAEGHFSHAAVGMRRISDCTFDMVTLQNESVTGPALYSGLGTNVVFASAYKTISETTSGSGGNRFFGCEFHGRITDFTQTASTIWLEGTKTHVFYGGLIDQSGVTSSYIRTSSGENAKFESMDWFASTPSHAPDQGIKADASAVLQSWVISNIRFNDIVTTGMFQGGSSATAPNLTISSCQPVICVTGNLVSYASNVFGGPGIVGSGNDNLSAVTLSRTILSDTLITAGTYTVLSGDQAKQLLFSKATSIAVTLPQAVGSFGVGWFADLYNQSAAGTGTVTITPTTSTINGASSLDLLPGHGCRISSDGVNWTVTLYTSVTPAGVETLANKTLTAPAINGVAGGTGVASANTASTLVLRNASGNFSAGTITAALTGNSTTATTLATPRLIYGSSFDGSAALAGPVGSAFGGTGVANNAASTLAISGNFGTTFTVSGTTGLTLPTTGTLSTLAGSETLTNKTLTSSVASGTWTNSGTWTIPAHTLNGTVSGGGNQLNNIIIGTSTPLAGSFTTASASSFVATSTPASFHSFDGVASTIAPINSNGTPVMIAAGAHFMFISDPVSGAIAFLFNSGGTTTIISQDAAGQFVGGSLSGTASKVSILFTTVSLVTGYYVYSNFAGSSGRTLSVITFKLRSAN